MDLERNLIQSAKYRRDIDGLRAIAVLAVIAFHFGFLPAGYLGVDVFFVISGYLITGIIYREMLEGRFSVKDFYLRRTRRIIPLVLFICLISLVLGFVFMLPDDLENLAQSVVATNLFNNNTLQILTTKNYWDVVNEFKPLMHTWSLGIEEQYYLLYPFLFVLLGKIHKKFILIALVVSTVVSFGLYCFPFSDYHKFYLLPFRFFELALGGIAAIVLHFRVIRHSLTPIFLIILLLLLTTGLYAIPNQWLLVFTVVVSCAILISANSQNKWTIPLLENRTFVFIGKISFSLYMWHQVLLAFARYVVYQEIPRSGYLIIFGLTILLSVFTYYIVEQPFRKRFSNRTVLVSVSFVFLFTTLVSLWLYSKGGIIRDIPELELTKAEGNPKIHAIYNDRISTFEMDFPDTERIKILAIGNSYMRDWCNIILESTWSDSVTISYANADTPASEIRKRGKTADFIFVTDFEPEELDKFELQKDSVWYVGTKNFGISNGIYYNYKGDDYCWQRTSPERGYLELNAQLQSVWKDRYLNLFSLVLDQNNTVPVFTPDCKFISQDTRHLTRAGAMYFAQLLDDELTSIFTRTKGNRKTVSMVIKPHETSIIKDFSQSFNLSAGFHLSNVFYFYSSPLVASNGGIHL